jgi:DNA-binding NtrC family response regulator
MCILRYGSKGTLEVRAVNEFKVMLVDDEKDFLETLCKRLVKRKLDVTSATGGREAIAKLEEMPVDVVVLDVRMPGMDGIETLKEIKKIRPSVEVIMLTAHADVQVAIEGMELGAFDYLMKPMEIDDLLYKLQDAYKKKWCREESEKCELPPSLQVS